VYPLLTRLEKEGLVATTTDENDGRGRKVLRVTADGRKSRRLWVLAGTEPEIISSVTDPIRSRTFFMGVLAAPRQLTYLNKLIARMELYLARTRAHLEQQTEADDVFDYLGALGAMKIAEARLEWLRVVLEQLPAKKA